MSHNFPQKMQVVKGVLRTTDGAEVCLWGSNFQPNLFWEYKFRMEHLGFSKSLDTMKQLCDDGLKDMKQMRCTVIRCHLTPSDFTDAAGNLVENMWLDMLGYMIAKAREYRIYVYITFINQMDFTLIEESFVANATREEWIFDPHVVEATHNYVRQLMNYKNPYSGLYLKDDMTIAVWGLINEPEYLTYAQMMSDNRKKAAFKDWLELSDHPWNDVYYGKYREEIVRTYIDELHDLLRDVGAEQPVVWNCNWPRMIDGRSDVFRAVATSKADAVSFCLYPGQDDVGDPFVDNPVDTSSKNYLPYLKHCYEDYLHLGWLRSEQFASKAKLVYEFETMYNATSSYLHPAIAKLFRSLGVQMATMWTHTFNHYAPYQGGSHVLNLRTTPKKAASYIIAGEVFRSLPRNFEFELSGQTEDVFGDFALSFDKDLSVSRANNTFMHSGDIACCPLELTGTPKQIVGYGNSPYVEYEGTGLYFINVLDESVEVELLP
ncbi:MAG: hypothetical protein VXZ08_00775, partial [Verrucomicrobiota bacterium]|nr:hypothetical protein [Verrucomicrobiota bacterium]